MTQTRSAEDEKLNLIEHLARWITWPRFIFALVMTFFLTSILFPFYWMVSSSFKTYAEIGGRQPVYIPSALRLDAYLELLDPSNPSFQNFGINIINSIKVAVPTSLIAVILAVLGAQTQLYSHLRGALNVGAPRSVVSKALAIAGEYLDEAGSREMEETWSRVLTRYQKSGSE